MSAREIPSDERALPDNEREVLGGPLDYRKWSQEEFETFLLGHYPQNPDAQRKIKEARLTVEDLDNGKWDKFWPTLPHSRLFSNLKERLELLRSGFLKFFLPKEGFVRYQAYDFAYPEEPEHDFCLDRNGRPYYNPAGWYRYAVYPNIEEDQEEIFKNWYVAYHGTKHANLESIIMNGLLPPGTKLKSGEKIENQHGKAGAKGGPVPIYVSPSIEYASHWLYTSPEQLPKGLLTSGYLYAVLQVRVRPGSFQLQGNTLADRLWGDRQVLFDENFDQKELEWLVRDPADIRVTGVMIRVGKIHPEQAIKERFERMKALTAKPRAPGHGRWEWNASRTGGRVLAREGVAFKPYETEVSEEIERAFLSWRRRCFVGGVMTETGQHIYFINFEKMEQIRTDNKDLRRAVRRVVDD